MAVLIASITAAGTTWLLLKPLLALLRAAGATGINFRGEAVPYAGGLTFILGSSAGFAVLVLLPVVPGSTVFFVWALLMSFAVLGLVDDLAGDRNVRGLRGHLRELVKGRLTSGGLKAVGGGCLAAVAALATQETFAQAVVGLLVVALSANLINLLDLRPGRAGKVFLLLALFLYFLSRTEPVVTMLAPAGVALAVYLPYDLNARVMMGDTGANFLGAAIGLLALLTLSATARIVLALVLLAVHAFCERYSLNTLFETMPVLSGFDRLGRRDD